MVKRWIEKEFLAYSQKKSILLLGPRQTGKTTLIKTLKPDLYLNLALTQERRRFELNPDHIIQLVSSLPDKEKLIVVDEIQKVAAITNPIQTLIDDKIARFVLTGSSARKLRKESEINLLPGRVISMRMDAFRHSEYAQDLENHLRYGSLPAVALENNEREKSALLRSYVDVYLEEEVRAEALVRKLPAFYRFLELAALESGKIISYNAIGQELGVAHTTIKSYFEVLEDCLVVERIDPITESNTRQKLTKSSKYLFFDLGVRRLAANEGSKMGTPRLGELFDNLVGLELLKASRNKFNTKLHFWRDSDGPEVDWVLKSGSEYLPVEVKWKELPQTQDARHLQVFLREYPCPYGGFVVCRTPRKFKITKSITALPWQEAETLLEKCE